MATVTMATVPRPWPSLDNKAPINDGKNFGSRDMLLYAFADILISFLTYFMNFIDTF